MKLAIYDFDGTIFEKETLPFIVNYYGKNHYSTFRLIRFYLQIVGLLAVYKLHLDPNMDKETFRAKASLQFMHLFDDMTKDEIILFFRNCTTELIQHFNPKVVESIQERKAEGYHTVICSGANTLLLTEIVKHLPIDTIIGTELVFLPDGTFDFNADIPIITGKNKPIALLEVFSEINIDWKNSFAYGDSHYDHYILSLTGNPVAVNPDERLRTMALEKNWIII